MSNINSGASYPNNSFSSPNFALLPTGGYISTNYVYGSVAQQSAANANYVYKSTSEAVTGLPFRFASEGDRIRYKAGLHAIAVSAVQSPVKINYHNSYVADYIQDTTNSLIYALIASYTQKDFNFTITDDPNFLKPSFLQTFGIYRTSLTSPGTWVLVKDLSELSPNFLGLDNTRSIAYPSLKPYHTMLFLNSATGAVDYTRLNIIVEDINGFQYVVEYNTSGTLKILGGGSTPASAKGSKFTPSSIFDMGVWGPPGTQSIVISTSIAQYFTNGGPAVSLSPVMYLNTANLLWQTLGSSRFSINPFIALTFGQLFSTYKFQDSSVSTAPFGFPYLFLVTGGWNPASAVADPTYPSIAYLDSISASPSSPFTGTEWKVPSNPPNNEKFTVITTVDAVTAPNFLSNTTLMATDGRIVYYYDNRKPAFTITRPVSSASTTIVETSVSHNLSIGDAFYFSSVGVGYTFVPAINNSTIYRVLTRPSSTTFTFAETSAGTSVTYTTGAGPLTHPIITPISENWFVLAPEILNRTISDLCVCISKSTVIASVSTGEYDSVYFYDTTLTTKAWAPLGTIDVSKFTNMRIKKVHCLNYPASTLVRVACVCMLNMSSNVFTQIIQIDLANISAGWKVISTFKQPDLSNRSFWNNLNAYT